MSTQKTFVGSFIGNVQGAPCFDVPGLKSRKVWVGRPTDFKDKEQPFPVGTRVTLTFDTPPVLVAAPSDAEALAAADEAIARAIASRDAIRAAQGQPAAKPKAERKPKLKKAETPATETPASE